MTTRKEAIEAAKDVEEVWESTGQGKIWVSTTNIEGKSRQVSVGGKPGMRLRITQYDRLRNQEKCLEVAQDPFSNGMLIRQEAEDRDDPNHLSPDQMTEVFGLTKREFAAKVDELSEYNVRRMFAMVDEVDATHSQIDILRDVIDAKWPIGGAMPIYDELKALGQTASSDR